MHDPGHINLKHLHYFHEVAREGSLTGAARRLHLADLELPGARAGAIARPDAAGAGWRAGLMRLLERHRDRIELDCVEGTAGGLLGQLAAHQLDAVLADQPMPPYPARSMRRRPAVEVVAEPRRGAAGARGVERRLPRLSRRRTADRQVRRVAARHFDRCLPAQASAASHRASSRAATTAHSSKVFAQRGFGIACVPTVIESDVATQFGLQPVGRVPPVSDIHGLHRFFVKMPRFIILLPDQLTNYRPTSRCARPLADGPRPRHRYRPMLAAPRIAASSVRPLTSSS